MRRFLNAVITVALAASAAACAPKDYTGLTVIPYGTVTEQITLDIRAGIVNNGSKAKDYAVEILADGVTVQSVEVEALNPGSSCDCRFSVDASDLGEGTHAITLKVNGNPAGNVSKINVIESDIRSDRQIDGAWCGLYHWSEEEGLHWNKDIKQLTDDGWKELVRSMHEIRMDGIVIQEVFRNQEYMLRHDMTLDTYTGRAFYPSELYSARMDMLASSDPLEAILSQADELDMHVLMGVGMWAWFDFSPASLEWHKRVARELWDMYGHHKSFYGFYVSEEADGSLCTISSGTPEGDVALRKQMVDFFHEFKLYCRSFAPDKPIMLATNSTNLLKSEGFYPELLKNLDILCTFCFARMPEGDLTGEQAADLLQSLCDAAGTHLWFDLEAFLFNPDMSLYPKPIDQIIHELTLFDNFEKVLCYQYPGVFSDPAASIRVGEERTVQLYLDYKNYLENK